MKNTYSVRYGHKKVHFRLRELGMWAAEAASMYIAQSRNLGNALQIEVSVEFVANFGEIGEEEGEHGIFTSDVKAQISPSGEVAKQSN